MRFLVVLNHPVCPPTWFGDWWREDGVAIHDVHAYRGDPIPQSLDGYSALVVLGGTMGANHDAECPWLPAVKGLIRDVVTHDQPYLGICLGHQLAAVALGGEVSRNPRGRSLGLTPVTVEPDACGDPLLGPLGASSAIQWNNDVVTRVPDGGQVLAHSPDGTVQAIRYGRGAWGVQFHPEASPDLFDRWIAENTDSSTVVGIDLDDVRRRIRDAEGDLARTWQPVAQRFAEIARQC